MRCQKHPERWIGLNGPGYCQECAREREALCPSDATAYSASSVPLGKRGPIEMHVGMVRLAVHAQCEPDGRWAARVPDLTEHCEIGATREDAIQRAIKAVSVVFPQNANCPSVDATASSRLADCLESPPPYRKHVTKERLWLVLDSNGDSVLWSDQELAVDVAVEALNHMAGIIPSNREL